MTGPSKSPEWSALCAHAKWVEDQHLSALFATDPNRLDWAQVEACGIHLDFSKNRMTTETLELLGRLSDSCDVASLRSRMVNGDTVNITEGRAALHMALRGKPDADLAVESKKLTKDLDQVKRSLNAFVTEIYNGTRQSSAGKNFKHVVNIGIGGSDLGPRLVCDALRSHWSGEIESYFVANIDAEELKRVLERIDPETTLFIVASKSFTTQETMQNAKTARTWLEGQLPRGADIGCHFAAVTANDQAARDFGIAADAIFGFWDWVGGRYSVWSAVGLSIMLALGTEKFDAFLAGAEEMDQHFLTSPTNRNIPILMALIGVWNRNFLGMASHAVLPYAHALSLLPSYLQQLEMESNGKSIDRQGDPVEVKSGPVVWGAAGTNGQHAFYQWLHQGTEMASVDIILPLSSNEGHDEHQDILVSHAIAQGEALAFGRDIENSRQEMIKEGVSEEDIERLLPHRIFEGNRPVTTLMMDELSPRRMGSLLALYEHKVFVQGCIWNINSFDQWGVELGKTAATSVLDALTSDRDLDGFDVSTKRQIELARKVRTSTRHKDNLT